MNGEPLVETRGPAPRLGPVTPGETAVGAKSEGKPRSSSIARQTYGPSPMVITIIGRRIAGNGWRNAVRRMDLARYEGMVKYVYGNGGRPRSIVEETGSKEAHGWGGPEIHAEGRWLEARPGPCLPCGHRIRAPRSKCAAFGRCGIASDDEYGARCQKYGFGSTAEVAQSHPQ